jgi:hypothetical protein
MFRHYPDALERATELDAQYGSNSPLDEMPKLHLMTNQYYVLRDYPLPA